MALISIFQEDHDQNHRAVTRPRFEISFNLAKIPGHEALGTIQLLDPVSFQHY